MEGFVFTGVVYLELEIRWNFTSTSTVASTINSPITSTIPSTSTITIQVWYALSLRSGGRIPRLGFFCYH